MWCQVMGPNERRWRGEEGENERKGVLCICTLQVPRKKVAARKKGGIERASVIIGFRGERNCGPEAGYGQVKVPNRGSAEQRNRGEDREARRAQESRSPPRHDDNCGCRFWIFFTG